MQGKPGISCRAVHMAPPEPDSSPDDSRKERIATCLETLAVLGTELVGSEGSGEDDGDVTSHVRILVGMVPCNSVGESDGVDIMPLQFYCAANITVPGGEKHAPLELKVVLDSASGITAISAPLLEKIVTNFGCVEMSRPLQEECKVTVADGGVIVVREQTQPVQVTLQIGHGHVSFRVAFVLLPGTDDVVMIGAKTMREKLYINVMRLLETKDSTTQVDFSPVPNSTEHASSANISARRSLRLRSGPMVTLVGMETARVEAGLQEPPDEFRETLLSRGPTMFMEVREEIKGRREALVGALHAAVQAGLSKAYVCEMEEIVLGQCFGAFRRALTGEPPARVEPMRVTLKQGADLSSR